MNSLDTILRLEQDEGGLYHAHISDDWMQGRTAYGGVTAAIALQTALTGEPGPQPLKCAQISFVGPVGGECTIEANLVRESKSSRFVTCEVTSDAGFGTHALFTFTGERDSHVDHVVLPMPSVPDPDRLEPVPDHPMRPLFTRKFDMRPVDGPRFKHGQGEADILTWVRFVDQPDCDPAVALLALGDALPPAAITLFKEFGPISSMNWTVHMLTETPKTRDGWWLLHSHSRYASGGFSVQDMMIWNRDGEPVARGGQGVGLYV